MTTINQSVTVFLDKYAKTHSQRTATTYKYGLAQLATYLKSVGVGKGAQLGQLKIDHFIDFVDFLASSELNRSSWGTYVAGARAFLKYLRSNDILIVSERDMGRLKEAIDPIMKVHRRLPQTPTDSALEKMRVYAAQMGTPLAQLRNAALVEFLASTGCRVDEAHKLKVSDVDFQTKQVRVIGKGDKERMVFPSKPACDKLLAYFDARKATPDAPMFVPHVKGKPMGALTTRGMWTIVNNLSMGSGVGRFHPHLFRHYFGTVMLDKTGDLALVQDLMGHSSPATTRVYADVATSKKAAACRSVFG